MREAGESEWGVGEVEEDGKGAGLGVSVSFSERTLLQLGKVGRPTVGQDPSPIICRDPEQFSNLSPAMRRPFTPFVNVFRSCFYHAMAPGEYSRPLASERKEGRKQDIKADDSAAVRDPRPVVISGPSGVGKGTLYKLLFQVRPLPPVHPSVCERDP